MRVLNKVAAFLAALSMCPQLFAVEFKRARTMEEAHGAVCRVSVTGARGTGSFIGLDENERNDRCMILTNHHVVDGNTTATFDFWTNGYQQSISGKVVMKFYDENEPIDAALAEVDPERLKKEIDPPFIALGGADAAPSKDAIILSAGCPKGRFVQAWKGKVIGYYNGATAIFQPGPVPGQSGSPILEVIDGELWQTGILTWLFGKEGADDSKGGGIPIANLYRAIRGRKSSTEDRPSPIPPDAQECADRDPYVLEFTQDNCAPCKEAEKDVAKLREQGYVVETHNMTRSEEAKVLARKYHIVGSPTFVVVDGYGVEVTSYIGSGFARRIAEDIEALKKEFERRKEEPAAKSEPLDLTIAEPEEPAVQDEPAAEQDAEQLNFSYVPLLPNEDQGYRFRAPIYENSDSYGNAGFFDDSNSRWLNRRREKPQEEEPAPPAENENNNRNRGRLFGGGSNSIDAQIDAAIDKIEKRIDNKVKSKTNEIKKQALDVYHKWRWRLLMAFIAAVIVGCLIADAISCAFKSAYRKWSEFQKWLKEEWREAFPDEEEPAPEPEKTVSETSSTVKKTSVKQTKAKKR